MLFYSHLFPLHCLHTPGQQEAQEELQPSIVQAAKSLRLLQRHSRGGRLWRRGGSSGWPVPHLGLSDLGHLWLAEGTVADGMIQSGLQKPVQLLPDGIINGVIGKWSRWLLSQWWAGTDWQIQICDCLMSGVISRAWECNLRSLRVVQSWAAGLKGKFFTPPHCSSVVYLNVFVQVAREDVF